MSTPSHSHFPVSEYDGERQRGTSEHCDRTADKFAQSQQAEGGAPAVWAPPSADPSLFVDHHQHEKHDIAQKARSIRSLNVNKGDEEDSNESEIPIETTSSSPTSSTSSSSASSAAASAMSMDEKWARELHLSTPCSPRLHPRLAELKAGTQLEGLSFPSPAHASVPSSAPASPPSPSPAPGRRRIRLPSYPHSFLEPQRWPEYKPIEEHGLIGNMRTCAMVGTDACIDWFCYPHFDSPSLFASALDSKIGGQWAIRAAIQQNEKSVDPFSGPAIIHKQLYHSETNVLISRFLTDTGMAQVVDYMPVGPGNEIAQGWLVRELEVVRGKMYFEIECQPAFNYARDPHEVQILAFGARFKSAKLTMILTATRKMKWLPTEKGGVVGKLKLSEGSKEVFVFREERPDESSGGTQSIHPASYASCSRQFDFSHPSSMDMTDRLRKQTISYWRGWLSKCTYKGRWREAIYRSALCLKLLTFEPTGAIVAAPTTSLPEEVGGIRNWDYRFTWIRDSSFVLYAFIKLGFRDEARAFMKWVEQRCKESKTGGELQIMYGLHGEHHLVEEELLHLEGYKKSKPVRIGNGAYDQLQLDIYGELLDTVYLSNKYAEPISHDMWCHVRSMVDWICVHWKEKDEGIWEVRGGRQHFVYSKVMSWVAVDRGIRLAERRSFPADISKWHKVRNEIYEEVLHLGWNDKRQAFVQHYGSDTLDASVLIMPLVFFMAPTDPRFVSTLNAILRSVNDDGLVSNNLVFRYNVEHTRDGLSGDEGTFSMCTFWAVEAASRLGMYDKEYLETARMLFEQMLGYANHLGLYSEEIGRRGEHLGNFPQAFTHLALISAAINLDKALDHH